VVTAAFPVIAVLLAENSLKLPITNRQQHYNWHTFWQFDRRGYYYRKKP